MTLYFIAIKKSISDTSYLNDHDFVIDNKMDKKLINLCRMHDEICEIAKQVNQMFSFQMLITMAYGFMSVTAQFYFLFCGYMMQVKIFINFLFKIKDKKKKIQQIHLG